MLHRKRNIMNYELPATADSRTADVVMSDLALHLFTWYYLRRYNFKSMN